MTGAPAQCDAEYHSAAPTACRRAVPLVPFLAGFCALGLAKRLILRIRCGNAGKPILGIIRVIPAARRDLRVRDPYRNCASQAQTPRIIEGTRLRQKMVANRSA